MFKMLSTMTFFGLLAIPAIYAQSSQPIQAKIPFAFAVKNTTLPAGNYQLMYNQTTHLLSIRGLERNAKAVFDTAIPAYVSPSSNPPGRLVFDCFGKTCYLAQVWQGAALGNRGLEVRPSHQMRSSMLTAHVAFMTVPAK